MKIKRHIFIFVLLLTVFGFAIQAADPVLTPQPGDPLRKNILDALRTEVKRIQGLDVVFVVRNIRVKDGWSWVHTLPQSPDGKNNYEDLFALMQIKDGEWKVVEIPCTEVDNPECIGEAGYYEGLIMRFPDVSVELFEDPVQNSDGRKSQ